MLKVKMAGIETELRIGRPKELGSIRGSGKRISSYRKHKERALGHSQLHTQFVPGVKWLVREVDHLTQSKAEVENEWICTSTFPYDVMLSIEINFRSCW